MELNATILLNHRMKKHHKNYSRKINRANFYREVANFAFLEQDIKNGVKPSNPLNSFTYSLAFASSKNIIYTYLFINTKVFLDFYEEHIQINKVYFNKFNYVHWLYKYSKKMYDNFLQYKDKDEYNPILCVIKRIDKEFFFFKLKKDTEVFERFVKKQRLKDMVIKIVKNFEVKGPVEEREKFIQSQISELTQAFIKNNDQISKIKYEYSFGSTKKIEYIDDVQLKVDRDVLNELLSYIRSDIYDGGIVRVKMYLIRKAIYGMGYKHEKGSILGYLALNRVQIDNKMNLSFTNKEIIANLKNSRTINCYTILDSNDIELIEE